MEKVRIEDVDRRVDSATVRRPLTDALDAVNVSLSYYELAPGDSFAFGYHMHENQEEIFAVQAGTVTFETEAGTVTVDAGEVIRFAPGEFQQGTNRGDDRVVAIVIGAPQEMGDSELRRDCPACGRRTENEIERTDDGEAVITRCCECGDVTGEFSD